MVKSTSVKDVDQHEIVRQIAMFLKKSGKVAILPLLFWFFFFVRQLSL